MSDDRCVTPGCPGDGRYSAPGRGHVEGCRHPVPPTDPAVTAADTALHDHFCLDGRRCPSRASHDEWVDAATIAVAAARPIIEAEKVAEARERIAAEIEAEAASLRATEQPDYIRAALDLEVAARIARGTT